MGDAEDGDDKDKVDHAVTEDDDDVAEGDNDVNHGDDVFDLLLPFFCLLLLVPCHICDMVNYLANTPLPKCHYDDGGIN